MISKGALLGLLTAGGLTMLAGVGLPILLLPESNLAPIIGFILAPPAALFGAALGWLVERRNHSFFRACLAGMLTGAIAGGIVIVMAGPSTALKPGPNLFFAAVVELVFAITGALVQTQCRPLRK